MTSSPLLRAVAFFDGQNLFQHAKEAYGYHHPNYDPIKLFSALCAENKWRDNGVRFYTGTPSQKFSPMWHGYWSNRLLALRRSGVLVEQRPLRYRDQITPQPDGTTIIEQIPQEKGIDIRIALDMIRLTVGNQLDVAVVFSQDQDLSEAAKEVISISKQINRSVKVVSAFPSGGNASSKRGIDGTDWIKIDRSLYDTCLDTKDYRPAEYQKSRRAVA